MHRIDKTVIDRARLETLAYMHTPIEYKAVVDGRRCLLCINIHDGGSIMAPLSVMTTSQLLVGLPPRVRFAVERGSER